MSMLDVTIKYKFSISNSYASNDAGDSKIDIIQTYREQSGERLGRMIVNGKKWQTRTEGDLYISELSVFVFTPNELRDYTDAKLKQKLIDFSERV